jgi:hypothetical protein
VTTPAQLVTDERLAELSAEAIARGDLEQVRILGELALRRQQCALAERASRLEAKVESLSKHFLRGAAALDDIRGLLRERGRLEDELAGLEDTDL